MRYWDTSALAKLYFNEPDSKTFETHLATTGMAVTAELARWELFRVAARKEAEGFIAAGKAEIIFARFLADVSAGKITLVAFDAAIESCYCDLVLRLHRLKPPTAARTLDCIHVATAHFIGAQEIVVTDTGFRKAAAALGLKVYP